MLAIGEYFNVPSNIGTKGSQSLIISLFNIILAFFFLSEYLFLIASPSIFNLNFASAILFRKHLNEYRTARHVFFCFINFGNRIFYAIKNNNVIISECKTSW